MAIKLSLISFSLKLMAISLFGITLWCVKTENVPSKPFTFYMHDILGGSATSERIVSGIIVNTQTSKLPFSKPNNRVFPVKGSIPFVDTSIDTNPQLGSNMHGSPTVIRNIDKNKVVIDRIDSLPYVTPNQLPLGATLDKLLFGRITVIDDEITKGHELGSEVIGKAQGFHLASSLDGSSQTMAFAALFLNEIEGHEEDAISFFGVHRTVSNDSYIAVVGGTGKYENARGYAKIETVHPYQHPSNGVETILQITIFLT